MMCLSGQRTLQHTTVDFDIPHGFARFCSCIADSQCAEQTAEHLTATSLSRIPPPSAANTAPVPLESARGADTSQRPVVKGDRSKSVFMEDEVVPDIFRAKLQDCACALLAAAASGTG